MFKRQTYWTGEQPQSQFALIQERDASKTLAQFVADAMGATTAQFTGFTTTPSSGLNVSIAQGAMYQYLSIDPTTWSTLAADTSDWLLSGLSLSSVIVSGFPAPTTSGQSIDYLIEAQIQVTDDAAVSVPFYNSANPTIPIYEMVSPARRNLVVFKVKAGTAATTGSQVAPTADSGWIPLYVVTIAYGQTTISSGNIALATGAPKFYGFVSINPNGNTPVYLSPGSQQTGYINISGNAAVGSLTAATALIGGATTVSGFTTAYTSGVAGDYAKFTAVGFTGSKQTTDSINIAGSIGYIGTHAGTDGDPYPLSLLNVAMLGGKLASDYALASGSYIILYGGTPTPGSGNAAITGTFAALSFTSSITSGAPLTVASTILVANLNANYLSGYLAGNSAGDIPISNGTLNTNLNAQLLNGLASSAFQPAGSYAVMNSPNSGTFTASGAIASTGGTGSAQITLGYSTTNSNGLNSGGAISYVQATGLLALLGTSVATTGPLAVGSPSAPASLTALDLIPSGLLRAGFCNYTVTYGGSTNAYPTPGNGTAFGQYASIGGQIVQAADTCFQGDSYVGYRCKITLNGSVTVNVAAIGLPTMSFYVDGVLRATVGGSGASGPIPVNLTSGTHVIDVVYKSYAMGLAYFLGSEGTSESRGGNITFFGWLPINGSGQISSVVTALVPG